MTRPTKRYLWTERDEANLAYCRMELRNYVRATRKWSKIVRKWSKIVRKWERIKREGTVLTDNEKAERHALKVIRENGGRIAYWDLSVRAYRALERLEKRGIIKWTVENYPVWGFEILKKGMK